MGFFSKIWKGIKKTVKKIGKGIKKAFGKFGKFMGKIGILGQVAMMFILPGIGAALGGAFTGAAGALATNTLGGALGAVGQAAGKVMQFVGNTVSKAGNVFNNVTKGVTDTLGNFAKTASNKMFGTSFDAASNFFGAGDSAFNRSFGENSRFANLTSDNVFFEDIKKNRQIELDRKTMNTLDEVVAESASDDPFGFNSEYGRGIQAEIDAGRSNLTASLDSTIQDPAALSQQQATALRSNLTGPENFSRIEIPSGPSPQMSALDAGVTAVDAPSLLDRLKTGVSNIPDRIYKKAGQITDDPLGYAFKGTEEALQQQMNLRVGQELGISEKPEYNVQNVSNVAYVPSMDSFASPQSQYGAPEIMNARSFEQQVMNNPNPYGYTAFQYDNYMAQTA
jgi:hypothetical protein